MKTTFKDKTVLITGGTGSFGANFSKALLQVRKRSAPQNILVDKSPPYEDKNSLLFPLHKMFYYITI